MENLGQRHEGKTWYKKGEIDPILRDKGEKIGKAAERENEGQGEVGGRRGGSQVTTF